MRSHVPSFHVETPGSLDQVLQKLDAEPGVWTLLAGGTDVMVVYEAGELKQRRFLNIWNLPELKGIKADAEHVDIGALTTYSEIQRHHVLKSEFPNLGRAGAETGGLAIQNRGTVGGNIANASPAADTPPALLVYDAELLLRSASGERWLPYDGFHLGYKQMALEAGEVIVKIRLPRTEDKRHHYYRKVGTRQAQAISKTVLAASVIHAKGKLKNVRLALGSVAPVTLRCKKTEALLEDQELTPALIDWAAAEIVQEIHPIDDIRSTAAYRRAVSANILRHFLCGIG